VTRRILLFCVVALVPAALRAQDPVRTGDTPPTEWVAALRKAELMDVSYFVPAHGFVDSAAIMREEERNFRLALERIIAEGTRLHDTGTSLENATAGARFEPYDGWTRAANNAFAALKRVYMELDGQLK